MATNKKTYRITGNTYPHRSALKEAGAKWNKDEKRWELTVVTRGMRRTDSNYYAIRGLRGLQIEEA